MTAVEETVRQTRYAWGGDQFLFVEIDESMSLQAFQRVSALADAIGAQSIGGVTDVCLTNASLLLRFDPDVVHPRDLLSQVQALENVARNTTAPVTRTRMFEFPVWYDDPVTEEVMRRFRSHHQAPHLSDLEFAASINEINGVQRN